MTAVQDEKNKTIGAFVAEDYRTAKVFERHGIDFCCGGEISLAEACREKKVTPEILLQEIHDTKREGGARHENYGAWSLSFLADYIVQTHHAWLDENLGQIGAYAKKIAQVHGNNHPELIEISSIFDRIATDLVKHLQEEEQVLFPAVKRLETARNERKALAAEDCARLRDVLRNLYRDHQEVGDATHKIRHLSKNFAIPEDACNTFAVTYNKLREFEDDLHKHVHLENNILFPKAERLLQGNDSLA